MEKLIGREHERLLFQKYIASNRCEFIAVYGRRRVGKTFLIRNVFQDTFDFYVTGFMEGSKKEELDVFHEALRRYGYEGTKAKTWMEAFRQLGTLLEQKAKTTQKPLVVFMDELPCFDTRNSKFVHALDYFWNSQASWIDRLKFVVCGSATAWMIRNVIDNKGGLHNRVTHEIHLKPFDLYQTECYLQEHDFRWSRLSIMQLYSIMGGIPYYLSLLDNDLELQDNIDRLFFSEDAEMRKEFARLFSSLYKQPEGYVSIIKLLATTKKGLTRQEIAGKLKIANNGHLTTMLDDLEYCDFIRRYNNGTMQNNGIYQLIDFYSQFYHDFVKKRVTDRHYWRHLIGTPQENTWYGLAFERVCMAHIPQIIHKLRYDTIHTEYYSWRSKESSPAAQIDLVIDRADGNISICEMKYSQADYSFNKSEYNKMQNRINTFRTETNCRKGIQPVLITTYSLLKNEYSHIVNRVVVMDDLYTDIKEE